MASDPSQLHINPQLECAETLASRFYTDPAVLALEKERIFRRTWQLVGTLSQPCGEVNGAKRTIADPESFFTLDLAGEPIVVVRDGGGTLRAFSNVCRHRAGPIAQGAGCRKVLNCAYHGWTYTLDGRLIGTPEVDGMEFFDRSTMGMVPLRCETWEQFIFVNFSAEGPTLSRISWQYSAVGPGISLCRAGACRTPRLHRELQLEGVRRQLSRGLSHPHRASRLDEGNRLPALSLRDLSLPFATAWTGKGTKPGDAHERVYPPGVGLKEALYFWVFPNMMLNFYPDNVQTNLIVPLSHDKTLTIFEWYFHDAASAKVRERAAKAIAFSETVQQEDMHICEAVQRGLQSATYDRGRYSVKRENGVHHFHMLLSEFLR